MLTPEAASRADELIAATRRLERELATRLAPLGLTVDAWRVLRLVAAEPGRTMSELTESVVVPPATTTRLVDALVAAALVHRKPAAEDRRSVVVHPTNAGRDLLARADSAAAAAIAEFSARA